MYSALCTTGNSICTVSEAESQRCIFSASGRYRCARRQCAHDNLCDQRLMRTETSNMRPNEPEAYLCGFARGLREIGLANARRRLSGKAWIGNLGCAMREQPCV